MLIDKVELQHKLKQKERYAFSYLFPAALDIFRSSTLPVTGLTILELFGVFVPIPMAGLAIAATLLGLSTLLNSTLKTAKSHIEENNHLNEILALNDDPRLKKIQEKLKIINKSEEEKIALITLEEYTLTDYLKNKSLSNILDDFVNQIDFIKNNKSCFPENQFAFHRKVEDLAQQLKSNTGLKYAGDLLQNRKCQTPLKPTNSWRKTMIVGLNTYGVDTVKGFIFGTSLAAFIMKLFILPSMLMPLGPYSLLIYLPTIALGITTYILIRYFKDRAEQNAKSLLEETKNETEDKIVALELLVDSYEFIKKSTTVINDADISESPSSPCKIVTKP